MTSRKNRTNLTTQQPELTAPKSAKISITQVGLYTPRDTQGNFIKEKTIKIYALTSDLQEASLIPTSDKGTHAEMTSLLCSKYKEYIKTVKTTKCQNTFSSEREEAVTHA